MYVEKYYDALSGEKKSVQNRGRDAHRKSNREELYQNVVIFHNGNSIYH